MKRTVITLACSLLSALVFGQDAGTTITNVRHLDRVAMDGHSYTATATTVTLVNEQQETTSVQKTIFAHETVFKHSSRIEAEVALDILDAKEDSIVSKEFASAEFEPRPLNILLFWQQEGTETTSKTYLALGEDPESLIRTDTGNPIMVTHTNWYSFIPLALVLLFLFACYKDRRSGWLGLKDQLVIICVTFAIPAMAFLIDLDLGTGNGLSYAHLTVLSTSLGLFNFGFYVGKGIRSLFLSTRKRLASRKFQKDYSLSR